MTSLPLRYDSSECDGNSGDHSISNVSESGNHSGSHYGLFWIKYVTYKIHNYDTTLQIYLSEGPDTILRQYSILVIGPEGMNIAPAVVAVILAFLS
jgi:hypothetical protein